MTCRVCKYDPGSKYNVDMLSSRSVRTWAAHHSDVADFTFQNGAEAWMHEALPSVGVDALSTCDFVYVSVFFTLHVHIQTVTRTRSHARDSKPDRPVLE